MPRPSPAPEIGPEELVATVESGGGVQVLDVRAPARLATGRVEIVPDERFHNIVGSQLLKITDPRALDLSLELPVTVVCGRGNDSKVIANHLNRLGFTAKSLRGGIRQWMQVLVPRPLPTTTSLDALTQFDRLGKGAMGYLLVSAGEALVVDPPRNIQPYLDAARTAGATIIGVADTHVHADYISGAPALAQSLAVPYYLHPADMVYPYDGTPGRVAFEPLHDGSAIHVGRATVTIAHTPGHTEGSVTYLVDDAAAFTGDFVFVRSIGRPDLAGKTEEWTTALWESIQRARRAWPPELAVYPAHYSSEAERRADHSVGGRFGDLLSTNPPLTIETADAFTAWVSQKKAEFPDVYRRIKAINVGLEVVDEIEAEELEMGKNECALG